VETDKRKSFSSEWTRHRDSLSSSAVKTGTHAQGRLPTRWAAGGRQVGRHTAACVSRYDLLELRMAAGERMRHTQADKFHGLSHGQCERNEIARCRRYRRERENARREASIRKKCRGLSAVSNANANANGDAPGWDIWRRRAVSCTTSLSSSAADSNTIAFSNSMRGESRAVCGRALSPPAIGSEAHKLRCRPWQSRPDGLKEICTGASDRQHAGGTDEIAGGHSPRMGDGPVHFFLHCCGTVCGGIKSHVSERSSQTLVPENEMQVECA